MLWVPASLLWGLCVYYYIESLGPMLCQSDMACLRAAWELYGALHLQALLVHILLDVGHVHIDLRNVVSNRICRSKVSIAMVKHGKLGSLGSKKSICEASPGNSG